MRPSELGVQLQRALEPTDSGVVIRLVEPAVDVCPALHREVQRVLIVRPLMYRPQGLGLHEFDTQPVGEPRHDLVLHFEQIDDRLVEPLGPDVRASFGFDELHVDAHPATAALNAAFQHVARRGRGRSA